jgi:ABC-2 type transport system ATP-binding protein
VGILATGRLRVEGTPEELKRSVGGDVLTVEVDPEAEAEAARILDARSEGAGRLTLRADDGGAAVPRALAALAERDIVPRAVTLMRPSLDDVFRQVADSRLSEQAEPEPQLRGVAA